jgi:signal transduction histidine kinase
VTIRLRLTLLSAALLVGATAVLLTASWWLLARLLDRTLEPALAGELLDRVGIQYALAVLGTALVALGLSWAVAGHALAPIRAIATTARRIGEERLDARVRLEGPHDELHELAGAFDAMLDRVQGAVEAQRRFVANASHELRTPLTVIRTEAEVTLDDPAAGEEELRDALRAAVETTERTEGLLDGLLVLAASTAGTRRDEVVALDAVAARALRAADVRADLRAAQVRGDEALLERLVGNLAENAVRHGAPGTARVAVRAQAGAVVVRVASGGARIAPEDLPRLTQPFERLHRRHGGGSGLGLSIVRAVAEAHGGTLELTAPARGGLVAEVRLPAA